MIQHTVYVHSSAFDCTVGYVDWKRFLGEQNLGPQGLLTVQKFQVFLVLTMWKSARLAFSKGFNVQYSFEKNTGYYTSSRWNKPTEVLVFQLTLYMVFSRP